jgi:hypothetical protein
MVVRVMDVALLESGGPTGDGSVNDHLDSGAPHPLVAPRAEQTDLF